MYEELPNSEFKSIGLEFLEKRLYSFVAVKGAFGQFETKLLM
tara:strand:+ start:487 stop:612 length:126 start_codon:yes stop_codon:yes gene_type:complete